MLFRSKMVTKKKLFAQIDQRENQRKNLQSKYFRQQLLEILKSLINKSEAKDHSTSFQYFCLTFFISYLQYYFNGSFLAFLDSKISCVVKSWKFFHILFSSGLNFKLLPVWNVHNFSYTCFGIQKKFLKWWNMG